MKTALRQPMIRGRQALNLIIDKFKTELIVETENAQNKPNTFG